MKKLSLKNLAIAFANNQKVLYFDDERELNQICRIVELREEEMTISNGEYQYDVEFDDIKIIVRPLSDLIKEIEVNGEKFVPFIKLAKIEAGVHKSKTSIHIEDKGYAFYVEYLPSWFGLCFNKKTNMFSRWDDGEGNDSCKNDLREKLFEWHFDLFGLIEKGLAVYINTI